MFKNLLVGADSSATALRAVETAVDLAKTCDAKLHIVTAYKPQPVRAPDLPAEFLTANYLPPADSLLGGAHLGREAGRCGSGNPCRNRRSRRSHRPRGGADRRRPDRRGQQRHAGREESSRECSEQHRAQGALLGPDRRHDERCLARPDQRVVVPATVSPWRHLGRASFLEAEVRAVLAYAAAMARSMRSP